MVAAMGGIRRVLARAGVRLAQDFLRVGAPVLEVAEVEREEFPAPRAAELNEPWRRWTGMTVAHEASMTRAERRRGIARFFLKIKNEYVFEAVVEPVRLGEWEPVEAASQRMDFSRLGDADFAWAAEKQTRQILTCVEQDFNISARQLNLLAREYRGVTATELIDGMRLAPLKAALGELLKTYARELWMSPGLYANVLASDPELKVWSHESKFFVDHSAEWRKKELYESRAERRAALIAEFDLGWKRGEQSKDSFAAKLGFQSFKDLNRACLNVQGKTVRQVAYAIVCEVVEIYLAAEVKMLRELAAVESDSHTVMRARFLYKGDCAPLSAERWDFWDACGDAGWRDGVFGWLSA